ncbi:MAG: ABC transporter ATP-binding protein [Nitrospirae bacterium]|nr:MAG: ABC transporter ATP-binding protein [Nitrospirota bacterium]
MIAVDNVSMRLRAGHQEVTILDSVSFYVPAKQIVAIVGPSGSGKSTLLGLVAGLDKPTAGSIRLNGQEITAWSEAAMTEFRRRHIGYVFQAYHLIPTLTALENVALPLELSGDPRALSRAQELLHQVGLADRAGHYPVQLSGGEQQRVAVARAFACYPPILLADEPTGNLDSVTGQMVIDLLLALNHDHGSTLLLVTHDTQLAERAERMIAMRDGKVVSDTAPVLPE